MDGKFEISSYRIHEQLGSGAMGEVYRATRRLDREMVAIKRVRLAASEAGGHGSTTGSAKVALITEFQVLASLHHPNVVQVLDYGFDTSGQPFVVMELLRNARELSDVATGQDQKTIVRYVSQLLQALMYLHRRGVLHRDLKPSNVLVTDDIVKVIDFGVAIATAETTSLSGTVAYMAPELLTGGRASIASDLYAVGLITYQLIFGSIPFDGTSTEALIQSILGRRAGERTDTDLAVRVDSTVVVDETELAGVLARGAALEPAPVFEVVGPLAPFITKLLQRNPADRYADAREALAGLALHSGEPLQSESQETRESFLQSAPLAGRTTEIAALRRALYEASDNKPSHWLIGGESGVGKSRILSELRTIALVRRMQVAQGQATSEGGSAYALWRLFLRQLCVQVTVDDATASVLKTLVPDIGALIDRDVQAAPPLEGEAAKARLFGAVEALIRGASSPLFLVLEDFHWAGAESVELLKYLVANLQDASLVLLATYRDDERPTLPQELPAMKVMKLARLNTDETSSLVRSMLGARGDDPALVKFLLDETEGNAFFMVEVLRALAEQAGELATISAAHQQSVLTGGMKRIIERRLEAVGPGDRKLVQLAAVAGRQVDLQLLAELEPGADLAGWQVRCANAAVLDMADNRWRFAHDKLREATLREIADADRVGMETRVATALEKLHGQDDSYAAALALHWGRAEHPSKAAVYYAKAGEVAERTAAPAAARAAYVSGLNELAKLPETLDVVRRLAELVVTYASCAWTAEPADAMLPRLYDALQRLAAAAGAVPAKEDRRRQGMLQLWIGRLELTRGNTEKALEHYRQALAVGEEIGDATLISSPSIMIGQALVVRGYWGNWEMLVRGFEWVRNNATFIEYGRVAGYIGSGLAAAGRLRDGMVYADPPYQKAKETGNHRAQAFLRIYHALMFTHAAKLEEAREAAADVVENARLTGDRLLEFIGLGLRVWALGRSGMLEEALEAMQAERAIRGALGNKILLGDWIEGAEAELLYASGQFEEAQRFTRALADESAKLDRPFSAGIAQRVLAHLNNRAGVDSLLTTRSFLQESIRQFGLAGMTMEAARTHLAWARIVQAYGFEQEASEHYAAHVATYEASGIEADPLIG